MLTASRRLRASFTVEQLDMLEEFFLHTPYPDVTMRDTLAQRLNMDINRVQVWFSNRRARNRKLTPKYVSSQINPNMMKTEHNYVVTAQSESPVPVSSTLPATETIFNPTIASSPTTRKCTLSSRLLSRTLVLVRYRSSLGGLVVNQLRINEQSILQSW
jgi:hypothetical protein